MEQSQRRSPHRLVSLTSQAQDDLLLTYLNTQQRWGTEQADDYDDLLAHTMQLLAENPRAVPLIENLNGVRKYFVRWKSARDGHHIFFQEKAEGIEVLRILHSKMNWQDLLS